MALFSLLQHTTLVEPTQSASFLFISDEKVDFYFHARNNKLPVSSGCDIFFNVETSQTPDLFLFLVFFSP